jgi:hypothetical protein
MQSFFILPRKTCIYLQYLHKNLQQYAERRKTKIDIGQTQY